MNRELTLKEAEKIVDDMYQNRWVECGIEDGNSIHMGNLDKLQYTELESASILLLRTEIRLQQENKKLKEHIEKYEHYCKTTGIEELMKENQKYKEVIDRAIEYIESKNNGHCFINGEERGAFTFILNFDAGRKFIWKLLDILKEVE